jgi:hypothetical protein
MAKAHPGDGVLRDQISESLKKMKKEARRINDLGLSNVSKTRRNMTRSASKIGTQDIDSIFEALKPVREVLTKAERDHSRQNTAVPDDVFGNKRRRRSDGSIKICHPKKSKK